VMEQAATEHTPRWVAALSGAVFVVVAYLLLGPRPEGVAGAVDVSVLPWVNAGLNATTAALLVAGWLAIRARRVELHRALMTTALGASAVFLVSYVVYHWFSAGPTRYEGPFRGLYLVVLLSHVVLATVILPAALTTWYRGWTGRVSAHRRVAPTTLALWLYVAVTGVAITVLAHR
jgi:putative membrane protein